MERLSKISLSEKFASFDDRWAPKILTTVDDFAIKIVKLEGEFVGHSHAEADEVFFVIAGGIRMRYRMDEAEHEVAFGPGELLRVPRGVEHMPVAEAGTELLLFERSDLPNTGDLEANERTVAPVRI
jgi:mannose-6-phosphate isomerase-like protein (cupin superfamily)